MNMSDKIKKNFWVEPEIAKRWDDFIEARGMSLTTLIKESIHAYIKNDAKDDAGSILKRLEVVSTKKSELASEQAAVDAELKATITRMDEKLTKLTTTVTPSEDDKARVIVCISRGAFSLKELVNALSIPIERAQAVLRDLKEAGFAVQHKDLRWEIVEHAKQVNQHDD